MDEEVDGLTDRRHWG